MTPRQWNRRLFFACFIAPWLVAAAMFAIIALVVR